MGGAGKPPGKKVRVAGAARVCYLQDPLCLEQSVGECPHCHHPWCREHLRDHQPCYGAPPPDEAVIGLVKEPAGGGQRDDGR